MSVLQLRVEDIAERRDALLAAIPAEKSGLEWSRRYTALMDNAVRAIAQQALSQSHAESVRHPKLPPPKLSIVATGGYGRGELSPYSDLDLTVIPLDDASPGLDEAVRNLFRSLHTFFNTVLRLELGYSYRLVNDAQALDGKSRTAMLDARLVAGDPAPFEEFRALFQDSFSTGEFILDKIREREAAFHKFHDTPLVVEPQLKEGAGGLRCFNCANWIRVATGFEKLEPTDACDKVIRARNLLHFVADKRLDLLSRQRQGEIADVIQADALTYMSQVAGAMHEVHQTYRSAVEALKKSRFVLSPGVLADQGSARLLEGVTLSDAAMGVATATQLGMNVGALCGSDETSPSDEIDGPEALHAVASGEPTLRNLDRCGLLEKLLPELTRCRTLMPSDSSHAYTVFEHTMRVVRNIDALKPGNYLGELKAGLATLGPLYLAVLLHDAGKFAEGLPHSESGTIIAKEVCARWRLPVGTCDLVSWLIREHLTMAKFIRVRDVANPETPREFAKLVGDVERLDMLALLTYADINAVSEGAWTPAQESLLRELRERTLAVLEGALPAEHDAAHYRRRLQHEVRGRVSRTSGKKPAFSETEIEEFLNSLPAHYVVSAPPELVPLHMQFARQAQKGEPVVDVSHDRDRGSTDVTICCLDSPGLLSRLLGVLYAWDISVEGLRVSTTNGEPGVALDTFTVSFAGGSLPESTASHVVSDLGLAMEGKLDVSQLLASRGKDPERKQENFAYVYVQGNPGILEVRAPRGRGLAYRFSRLITQQGWNIVSARFGQWAGRAAAAFYVLGTGGRPLLTAEVVDALKPKV